VFVRSVGGDRRSILEYCSFLIGFWVDFLNRIHEARRMGGVLAKGLWRAQCGFFGGEGGADIFSKLKNMLARCGPEEDSGRDGRTGAQTPP
jgi:hypothetical protein